MRLRSKVLLLYICIMMLVLIGIGVVLPSSLNEKNLESIREDTISHLRQMDFALSSYMSEVEYDIREIAIDPDLRYADDSAFTSFLNVTESTFRYSVGDKEQAIIDELNALRITHPSVNSVYMGRETGTFVRSHPRARPTAYDPRDRPWYILGTGNPGKVMRTDPYPSLTTADVNIGIVTTIPDSNGSVIGVLGADITLENLTGYITGIDVGREGEIILTNETGTILASRDPVLRFTDVRGVVGEQAPVLFTSSEGFLTIPGKYLVFYTSPKLGWKYLMIIPFTQIEKEMSESIVTILLFVILSLILLSIITLIAVDRTIILPITRLTGIAREISETGDLNQKIPEEDPGEIGELSRSFSSMLSTIRDQDERSRLTNQELSRYRDHLTDLVAERTQQLEDANHDLRVAKERAEDADRIKSAFLATMSHELRTPLNSIIGFTGIILQGLAGPLSSEQEKQLGMVRQSASHLLALINDVLDISKIEAGELKISSEEIDISASLLSVARTMQPAAEAKGLRLVTDVDPRTGVITGDRRRLEQVIMNLLSNAIKFTEEGAVSLKSERKEGRVVISVSDSGIGIAPENISDLYTPFHQIDSGTTRKHEGTGLGLSICKKLVEMHGGTIAVESEAGVGSTFTVTIPAPGG